MAFDYSRLIGRIAEKGYTRARLALEIGITPHTLSAKLKGRGYFTQDEILKLCMILEIDDIHGYFFTQRVTDTVTA